MISRCGRCGATSSAAACAMAAVSEKLPAATTPTPARSAAAAIAAKSSAPSPEVPMTTATPRSIAVDRVAEHRLMRGVVHEDVDALQRVGDVIMDRHTVGRATPGGAEIVAGGGTTHGGAQRQVLRRQDAFGHRPAGPTGRTRDAHVNRHDEHGTDVRRRRLSGVQPSGVQRDEPVPPAIGGGLRIGYRREDVVADPDRSAAPDEAVQRVVGAHAEEARVEHRVDHAGNDIGIGGRQPYRLTLGDLCTQAEPAQQALPAPCPRPAVAGRRCRSGSRRGRGSRSGRCRACAGTSGRRPAAR